MEYKQPESSPKFYIGNTVRKISRPVTKTPTLSANELEFLLQAKKNQQAKAAFEKASSGLSDIQPMTEEQSRKYITGMLQVPASRRSEAENKFLGGVTRQSNALENLLAQPNLTAEERMKLKEMLRQVKEDIKLRNKPTGSRGDMSAGRYPVSSDTMGDVIDYYKRNVPGTPS